VRPPCCGRGSGPAAECPVEALEIGVAELERDFDDRARAVLQQGARHGRAHVVDEILVRRAVLLQPPLHGVRRHRDPARDPGELCPAGRELDHDRLADLRDRGGRRSR